MPREQKAAFEDDVPGGALALDLGVDPSGIYHSWPTDQVLRWASPLLHS
jgi:hypothetical protein